MNVPVVHQTAPNPQAAWENRQTFDALGVTCFSLIGPTGSGKTSVLEAMLPRLTSELRVGVVQADVAATCDAQRIARLGVPVVQVLTDGECHLRADQLQKGMAELPLAELDLVVVENVGGVVCPAEVHLGEHLRVSVLSLAGGAQVLIKYPRMLQAARLVLLTKHDLLSQVDFDLEEGLRAIRRFHPGAEVICTDIRGRVGIDRAAGWLLGYVRAQVVRRQGETAGALA